MKSNIDTTILIWIDIHYACAGIIVSHDMKVIQTAPIFKWMLQRSVYDIKPWLKKKKAKIKIIQHKANNV